MAWITEQAFFERSLRNELVSLQKLKLSTIALNLKLAENGLAQIGTADIDEAIDATHELLKAGAHHP